MTPTNKMRTKLRLLLNDKDSKSFSDDEINMLIDEADCIYCAAAQGWLLKATMYETTAGEITEYKTGEESYKSANIKDLVSVAYSNSNNFKAMCDAKKDIGSIILGLNTEINI
ncbi:hypothetical protein K234311028_12720 [Clostridium tetani]|uniref:Phage protein n=2 Tax=Clostridium tetani TaxID=1513 RepID=A0ABC8ECZ5_CLOTA|nr:hypothetical protein K234311028_12720 [Clostridium tetani]